MLTHHEEIQIESYEDQKRFSAFESTIDRWKGDPGGYDMPKVRLANHGPPLQGI